MADTASSTSEEFSGLNTNDVGKSMLDGKIHPLKVFVLEDIYTGKLLGRRIWIKRLRHMRQARTGTGERITANEIP